MADGKAILAGLAGLTKGIAEGLRLRQEREMKEKELDLKNTQATQEMQAKAIKSQLDMEGAQSRNAYYKRLGDLKERTVELQEEVVRGKTTKTNSDATKDLNNQIIDLEKREIESQESLSDVESEGRRWLKKDPTDPGRMNWEERVKRAKQTYDSVKANKNRLQKKVKSIETQTLSPAAKEKLDVLDKLKSLDQLDDQSLMELDQLEGDARQAAIKKLSTLV